jgi:hypothetical protein
VKKQGKLGKKTFKNLLQRYLIECNTDIEAPQYLRRNRFQLDAPSFDFSPILVGGDTSTADLERRFQHLSLYGTCQFEP